MSRSLSSCVILAVSLGATLSFGFLICSVNSKPVGSCLGFKVSRCSINAVDSVWAGTVSDSGFPVDYL